MAHAAHIPVPYDSEKDDREDARGRKGQYTDINNTCHLCGRKATGSHFIALADGMLISTEEAMGRDDNGFMGFYPVGSTCRKVMDKAYVGTRKRVFGKGAA